MKWLIVFVPFLVLVYSYKVQPNVLGEAEKISTQISEGEMGNFSLVNSTDAVPPKILAEDVKCVDLDKDCFAFASKGECAKNPSWMLENCKVSCHNCGEKCQDSHELCNEWFKSDECQKNSKYMHTHCAKSCGTCAYVIANPLRANNHDDL